MEKPLQTADSTFLLSHFLQTDPSNGQLLFVVLLNVDPIQRLIQNLISLRWSFVRIEELTTFYIRVLYTPLQ